MQSAATNSEKNTLGKYLSYLAGAVLISIPVLIFVNSYTEDVLYKDQEKVAILITLYFWAGVAIGRYIAILWVPKNKAIPKLPFVLLPLLILTCTAVVFFVAQFASKLDRFFLNMLFFSVPFFILSLAIGILVKLVRISMQRQLYDAKAEAQQSQSELHLLQSQLSPHFLFNTLNNLYGLSITEHEKIPPLLLKLSELLRYSVYDAKELFVPLKEELNYINNYIEFEKIRIGDRLILNVDIEEPQNTDIKIAPMLLIVFIENAFKHSKNTAEQYIQVEISLKIWGSYILFFVKNSQNQSKEKGTFDKNSGFGLANVRKRLELLYLYPSERILEIENDEEFYSLRLQLKIK
jgi:sensor histidine kinase YesM